MTKPAFFRLLAQAVLVTAWVTGCGTPDPAADDAESGALSLSVIANPGFENGFTGWKQVEPAAISDVAYEGRRAAKLGKGGSCHQRISGLSPGTTYVLTGWTRGAGLIGVRNAGATDVLSEMSTSDYAAHSVTFTTGASSTTADIHAASTGGNDFRVDALSLTAVAAAGGSTSKPNPLPIHSAAASGHDGNVPENTVDGSLQTRWSARGSGQWIEWDLGSVQTISAAKIAFYKGASRTASFDLYVSDGTSSHRVLSRQESSGASTQLETFSFQAVAGRYLRFVGLGNTSNDWNSLTEVQVWGSTGTSVPGTDAGSPDAGLADAGADAGVDGGAPSSGTLSVPADLLDLQSWKLTLPIDTGHAGSPDEIRQPELSTFSLDPYFVVTGSRDGVRFRAHCGGATTSNSGYPRSELREMTSAGTSNASWSTTSGTHTLFIRQAITHLPDVKSHVVAGQIHDASDDLIMIRLENQRLFVEANGSDVGVLDPAYTLGRIFEVKIVAASGRIKVHHNGVLKVDIARSASGCYFKAGAYTQSNTSRGDAPDAYGEVVIYQLQISHQ